MYSNSHDIKKNKTKQTNHHHPPKKQKQNHQWQKTKPNNLLKFLYIIIIFELLISHHKCDVGFGMESSDGPWGQEDHHHATAWNHGIPPSATACAGLFSLPVPISQMYSGVRKDTEKDNGMRKCIEQILHGK